MTKNEQEWILNENKRFVLLCDLQLGKVLINKIKNVVINRINSSLRTDNTSSVKGVSFSKSNQKWFACINIHGIRINGGYYEKIEDAIKARFKLEEIYFLPINKI